MMLFKYFGLRLSQSLGTVSECLHAKAPGCLARVTNAGGFPVKLRMPPFTYGNNWRPAWVGGLKPIVVVRASLKNWRNAFRQLPIPSQSEPAGKSKPQRGETVKN